MVPMVRIRKANPDEDDCALAVSAAVARPVAGRRNPSLPTEGDDEYGD